jgi:hypothetical protein
VSAVRLQRQIALAGIALLGTLGALALTRLGDGSGSAPTPAEPEVRWGEARVAIFGADRLGEETGCGVTLTAETAGVAHPVLPCGVRLVVESGGQAFEVRVIERVAVEQGRAFDVTPALAERLEIRGGGAIRWRFAG